MALILPLSLLYMGTVASAWIALHSAGARRELKALGVDLRGQLSYE